MRVRLIKKLADRIDDIDLTEFQLGDSIDLAASQAELLIAEGWAVPDGTSPGVCVPGSTRAGRARG
jgi:hypothetical protein